MKSTATPSGACVGKDSPDKGYRKIRDEGDSNNNDLVFRTFDEAIQANPDAHPLFHSDRGPYTNRAFHKKLESAGCILRVSRSVFTDK